MLTIIKESKTQSIVLVVNILSFKNHHVRTGKVKYDMPKPSNLAAHASFVVSTAILVPYQKQMLAGIPYMRAAAIGRFSHHFQM